MSNNNITIGSDPEFVIMCGDSVANALEIFSRVFEEDLLCIEPEEPDEDDLINFYNENPTHHLNEALNNTGIKHLINIYDEIANETFVKLFKQYDYNNKQNTYKLYLTLNIDQQIKFDNYLIDEILNFKSKVGFNIKVLPDKIQEKILDNIKENWEYDFSPDSGDYAKHFCSAEIGCDGHSITGEMRPKARNTPIEHFNEILKLIKELSDTLEPEIVCYDKELQVKAGTVQGLEDEYETILLGGHIHIGYEYYDKIYSNKLLGQMLSLFVGIPLTLIEKPEEIYIRHKTYGEYNDVRAKVYGLEFRMPSSWLVSPEITIGALSLTYVVADEFITGLNTNKKTQAIALLFEGTAKYEHIYNKMLYETASNDIDTYYYDKLISMSELLYENIKTMRLYPEYAEYIDYIFDMIKKYEYWNSDADILTTWSKLF